MKIEDTLRDALQRDAAELVPVGPGPDHARRRAFRHRRRLQSGVVVLSAVGLMGGALAIIETRPSGPGPRVTAQPVLPPTELAWRTVDGTALYQGHEFTTADGVTYSLSTAPGAKPVDNGGPQPQVLYSTRDGVTWSQAAIGDQQVEDLTEGGGVLYAVGTGPGSAGPIDYNLSTSSDGGAQWNKGKIPVEFTPLQSTLPATIATSLHVARSVNTTVVMAKASYNVDLSSKLGKDASYRITATGVDILGKSDCEQQKLRQISGADPAVPASCKGEPPVTGSKTWAELGVSNPEALHQQLALVRPDGGDWKTVSVPNAVDSTVLDVTATTNGFLMAEQNWSAPASTVALFSSADGRSWSPVGSVPAFDSVSISGDKVIGVNTTTADMYVSNDAGGTWTATQNVAGQLPGTDPVVGGSTVDAGPLGYAALVTTGQQMTVKAAAAGLKEDPNTPVTLDPNQQRATEHTYLMYSSDGIRWKVTDLAAQGAPANAYPQSVEVGRDHVDVSYLVSGPPAPDGSATNKLVDLLGTPKA